MTTNSSLAKNLTPTKPKPQMAKGESYADHER
jgi:hypothetical protein